tara:strand:- start:162 stop:626 length:465 start_codon:yes stop_codon:yes gene_type:complete
MIKTLSHCTIKKFSSLSFNKLSIFISLFLFSCTSHLIQAEEVKPKNLKCGSNSGVTFFEKNGLFTEYNKGFNNKLHLIDKNLGKEDFNFIYISKPQNSGGYTLELEKIVKKKNKYQIYFKENKPPEGSANLMAITATYCLLKIENLEKAEVFKK